MVVAGWCGGQPRWAPLFVGLGDGDVGPAAAPTGDHDLADGVGLLVPAPVVSFPPDPLGTAGQHPDTSFFWGGGGCVCPADPALAHHHGLISRCGSQWPGKGRIEPRRSPAPWPTCSRAALQPPGMPFGKGRGSKPSVPQFPHPAAALMSPVLPPFQLHHPQIGARCWQQPRSPKPLAQGMRWSPGKGFRQDLAPDYLQQLLASLLFAVRHGSRMGPRQMQW